MTSQSSFKVSVERHQPNVLHLRGSMDAASGPALQRAVDEAMAAGDADVVLDLGELDVSGAPVFATIDAVADAASAAGRRLVLRGTDEDLARVPASTLSRVHVEPMAALRLAAPAVERPMARSAADPGTPRREGAGFVASYGQGRRCAVSGCPTMLSRYNPKDVCANHLTGRRD